MRMPYPSVRNGSVELQRSTQIERESVGTRVPSETERMTTENPAFDLSRVSYISNQSRPVQYEGSHRAADTPKSYGQTVEWKNTPSDYGISEVMHRFKVVCVNVCYSHLSRPTFPQYIVKHERFFFYSNKCRNKQNKDFVLKLF